MERGILHWYAERERSVRRRFGPISGDSFEFLGRVNICDMKNDNNVQRSCWGAVEVLERKKRERREMEGRTIRIVSISPKAKVKRRCLARAIWACRSRMSTSLVLGLNLSQKD